MGPVPDFEIVLPENGSDSRAWRMSAGEAERLLADAETGPVARLAVVGDRLDQAARAALADKLVDDPAEADVVLLADTPVGVERQLQVLARTLDPQTVVVTVDWSVANWPCIGGGDRTFRYRPGDRATWGEFVEPHLLAIVHPEIDGFLVARFTAHVDFEEPTFVVEGPLEPFMEAHSREGPLGAGQRRQLDLELHPGGIPRRGVTGRLTVFERGEPTGIAETFTLATSPRAQCVLSGYDEGPIGGRRLLRAIRRLEAGRTHPTLLAARIWAEGNIRRRGAR